MTADDVGIVVDYLLGLGLTAEELDGLVHDHFARRAGDVNNGGLASQVALLLDRIPVDEVPAAVARVVRVVGPAPLEVDWWGLRLAAEALNAADHDRTEPLW